MSSQEVIDTLGDLKILTNKMINQLRQLEIFITTNRTDRAKILRAPISLLDPAIGRPPLELIQPGLVFRNWRVYSKPLRPESGTSIKK